eukprot:2916354-Prymnesium_polylepis.1
MAGASIDMEDASDDGASEDLRPWAEVVFIDETTLAREREVVWIDSPEQPPQPAAKQHKTHKGYRPDVDGLRAVAV